MSSDYIIVGGELYHADDFLAHYGVKGMKWGVRRYQNEDGTRTEAGKKRDSLDMYLGRKLKKMRMARMHRQYEKEERDKERRHKKELAEDQQYRDESGRLNAQGKKRYQYSDDENKSLSPEGEAYIRKYGPLNGPNWNRNRQLPTSSRDAVVKKYNKEYDAALIKAAKKQGKYEEWFDEYGDFGGDGYEAATIIGFDVADKMQTRYERAYAEATLKDLGFDVSEKAIRYCTSRNIMS